MSKLRELEPELNYKNPNKKLRVDSTRNKADMEGIGFAMERDINDSKEDFHQRNEGSLLVLFLEELPEEILLHMLTMMNTCSELSLMSSVSKAWNRRCKDQYLWRK